MFNRLQAERFLSFLLILGHVQLTYFCSWSDVEESCDKQAIANMYCAPGETYAKISVHFSIDFFRFIS